MRVAIVGAGFAGLAAAYRLTEAGVEVDVYEASKNVGGLASGFSLSGWEWSIERFYHHVFANDNAIIRLSREVNCPAIFFRPTTALYFKRKVYSFDSPMHLLRFPHLSYLQKLHMGIGLGFLKIMPIWKPLEHFRAHRLLKKLIGTHGYKLIWEPLLKAKFGLRYRDVNAAWFWARIHKRTPSLGYFPKGFQGLADCILENIKDRGGVVHLNYPISAVSKERNQFKITSKLGVKRYDKLLVTTPTEVFLKIVKGLPAWYRNKLSKLETLDALNVTFISKRPVMDNVYWLNITDSNLPFVVVVQHTNMVNKKFYGGNHIVYLGAYLVSNHRLFQLSKSEVVKLAINQLTKIAKSFNKNDILESFVFRGRGAQPFIGVNYSSIRPAIKTPIENLFLANMNVVYPWDRGTNYAVELGEKVAEMINK